MKRQRQPNFTSLERETLIALVSKFKSIIENKQTDGVTIEEKNKAWNAIAKEFNAVAPNNCSRTEEALKVFYKNLKKELRKKAAENKKETYLTGGGPEAPQLSDECNRILSIVNKKSVFGLTNQFDSDVVDWRQCSATHTAHKNEAVNNLEETVSSFEPELDFIEVEDEESGTTKEKTDWTHHKASDLKRRPNTALLNKIDSTLPVNNIEVIFQENLPPPNVSSLATIETENTPSSITPKKVRSLSRRRPNTVKTLTSSALGEKYEILVNKKIELAECLKKEHEARMTLLDLDIKLKKKQLESST